MSGEAETTAGCEVCLRAEAMKNDNAINRLHDLKQKHVVKSEETYCDGLFKFYYPAYPASVDLSSGICYLVRLLSGSITIAKNVSEVLTE